MLVLKILCVLILEICLRVSFEDFVCVNFEDLFVC